MEEIEAGERVDPFSGLVFRNANGAGGGPGRAAEEVGPVGGGDIGVTGELVAESVLGDGVEIVAASGAAGVVNCEHITDRVARFVTEVRHTRESGYPFTGDIAGFPIGVGNNRLLGIRNVMFSHHLSRFWRFWVSLVSVTDTRQTRLPGVFEEGGESMP